MKVLKSRLSLCLIFLLLFPVKGDAVEPLQRDLSKLLKALESKCTEYGWNDIKPDEIKWEHHRTTHNKYPLVFAQFGSSKNDCVLFLGSVHGDELPTVYLLLKLAFYVKDNPSLFKDKCIVIAPLVNPDGFFAKPPKRVNANGIDINRNFPTKDWYADALRQWNRKHNGNRRYYPGKKPGSEQETLFQITLIKRYKPQKILSVHSPLGFYDFDGPSSDLDSLERWLDTISRETNHPLKKFGFFPGSLGNYAGHERNIFTLTLELPSSEPRKGSQFFDRFQPAFLKFLNLSIHDR
ncbi:MAG: M14 family zinc carboxypeptidase [Syntrophales bacterium]